MYLHCDGYFFVLLYGLLRMFASYSPEHEQSKLRQRNNEYRNEGKGHSAMIFVLEYGS